MHLQTAKTKWQILGSAFINALFQHRQENYFPQNPLDANNPHSLFPPFYNFSCLLLLWDLERAKRRNIYSTKHATSRMWIKVVHYFFEVIK